MFFHIDESGNTGNNLFDRTQPRLSYGLLSSKLNVDALGIKHFQDICKSIEVTSLHANELGVRKLTKIAALLSRLHNKMGFNFDYYFIDKKTFALVAFFEAVFDQGLNKAVKCDWYWTPLRFPFMLDLFNLFDDNLLELSWNLCIDRKIEKKENQIVDLLVRLRDRIDRVKYNQRYVEILKGAFNYGIKHPLELDFGMERKNLLSPNSVCFQFICIGISRIIRSNIYPRNNRITVDIQSQYNNVQEFTLGIYQALSNARINCNSTEKGHYINHPIYEHLTEDDILLKGMPSENMTVSCSSDSIGLQIADIYLWLVNKMLDGVQLSEELLKLMKKVTAHSFVDGISKERIFDRWNNFEKQLPQLYELSEETIKTNSDIIEDHREFVKTLNIHQQ
jgi:hypothetical protein